MSQKDDKIISGELHDALLKGLKEMIGCTERAKNKDKQVSNLSLVRIVKLAENFINQLSEPETKPDKK